MKTLDRRSALAALGGVAAAFFLAPRAKGVRAQEATLLSKPVAKAPTDLEDPLWKEAEPLAVPLAPQAVVKPRNYEGSIKSLKVRSLYDGERLVFLLEWSDPKQDLAFGGVGSFRDAVAIQFPAQLGPEKPFFGMGEDAKPVTIYQWKSDWQLGRDLDVGDTYQGMASDYYPYSGRKAGEIAKGSDYGKPGTEKSFNPALWAGNPLADAALQEKTPVEKLTAAGFGTLATAEKQDAQGKGVWKGDLWRVLISIPRAQDQFSFDKGAMVPLAFAAWDGAKGERGAQKSISTWYFLALEEPAGALPYISPILVAAGAAVAELLALRGLRSRRAGEESQTER